MSGTLQTQSGFAYLNNGRTRQNSGGYSVNIIGNGVVEEIITVPIAGCAIPLGSVTIPGFGHFRNAGLGWLKIGIEPIGGGTFVPFLKLYANSLLAVYDSPDSQVMLDEDSLNISTGANELFVKVQQSSGSWATSQTYAVGVIVTDTADSSLWVCQAPHTSRASGAMSLDRTAQPTYWTAYIPMLDYELNDR